jgi:phytol kinase
MNPFLALVITFAVALIELRLLDFFAHRGWIESRLSRKLIHILTGPLFVLCWLLFPDVWYSRWLAALVPFAITLPVRHDLAGHHERRGFRQSHVAHG